jgi:hypothetical protein
MNVSDEFVERDTENLAVGRFGHLEHGGGDGVFDVVGKGRDDSRLRHVGEKFPGVTVVIGNAVEPYAVGKRIRHFEHADAIGRNRISNFQRIGTVQSAEGLGGSSVAAVSKIRADDVV